MNILVTGAAGFIGRHTFPILGQAGHDTSCLDRHWPKEWIPGMSYPMSSYKTDITNSEGVMRVFELTKPDAVLHLAANSSLQKGIEDPVYDAQNNIIGTLNVLQAMKDNDCKRIVFASTSAVYDPYARSPYTEETPTNPITPYGISKLACEYYIKTSGLDHVILRYGNVYGSGQKPLGENILIARAIAHMLDGEPFVINGDGDQIRDFINVKDVAMANLRALENPMNFNGVLNVSLGVGHSVNTIIKILKYITGHDKEIKRGPGVFGETRAVIMDPSKIERIFPWKPTIAIDEGLKRTVEAWKKSKSSIPVS